MRLKKGPFLTRIFVTTGFKKKKERERDKLNYMSEHDDDDESGANDFTHSDVDKRVKFQPRRESFNHKRKNLIFYGTAI